MLANTNIAMSGLFRGSRSVRAVFSDVRPRSEYVDLAGFLCAPRSSSRFTWSMCIEENLCSGFRRERPAVERDDGLAWSIELGDLLKARGKKADGIGDGIAFAVTT